MASELYLHPSDPSAASRAALRVALELAAGRGARLLVLGTVLPYSWSNRVTYGNDPAEPETSLRQLEDELRDRVRQAGGETLPGAEYLTVVGDLPGAVVRVAAELRCDLVVMGSPRTVGWWERLVRSAPDRVAGSAPCPVLLVPEGGARTLALPVRAA